MPMAMMKRLVVVVSAAAALSQDCRQEACPLEVEDASLMQDAPARSSAEEADRIDGPWRKQWRWKQGWWHGRRGYYSYYSGGSTTGTTTEPAPGPPPPPLFCEDAEPQSPRDLTPGFVGGLEPRVRPLDGDATPRFIQANLHFHLGAEHRSEIPNGYFHEADDVGLATPLVRPDPSIREGYFCGLDDVSSDDRDFYNFTFCKDVSVNYTYEFHWVYSTGAPLIGLRDEGAEGQLGITDGLGGALNRTNNPKIIVRGQVCRIIYNKSLVDVEADYDNFVNQWRQPPLGRAVRYIGSTTGTDFNNSVCSPLEVNWHVDTECCTLSAQTFDRLCEAMEGQGLSKDLAPKPSRILVSEEISATVAFPLSPSPEPESVEL